MDSGDCCRIWAVPSKVNHFKLQWKYLNNVKRFVVERNKYWKSEMEAAAVKEEDVEDAVVKPTKSKERNSRVL